MKENKVNKVKQNRTIFLILLAIIILGVSGTFVYLGIIENQKNKNVVDDDEYLLDIYESNESVPITRGATSNSSNTNKIHYISNGPTFEKPKGTTDKLGASPANTIVLESNGHFALIDTGLENNNDKNKNHATAVVEYLKKIGAKKLDFILITHDHYDHLGGLNYILDNVKTDIVYIKPYYSHDRKNGVGDQKSRDLYVELLNKYFGSSFKCDNTCKVNPDKYREALASVDNLYGNPRNNVGVLKMKSTLYKINANAEGKIITLGNMTIKLYNTTNLTYHKECYGTKTYEADENANSIITYITMGNKKALIAGDLEKITKACYNAVYSNKYGKCNTDECSIMEHVVKKLLGNNQKLNIDLLELPHHGYSSCDMSAEIRDKLNAKTIVIPNWVEKIKYYYEKGGPYASATSCRKLYFDTTYYQNENNKIYVGRNNTVFNYSNNSYSMYIN